MPTRSRAPRCRSLVALVLCVVGACAGCTSGPAGQAPTQTQIASLLARHAAAVLSRSASAFMNDVDTAHAASDFRSRQRTEFTNLAGVPLQSWTYTISSVVHDSAPSAAASKRLGAPATIVDVTLSYRLRQVDQVPSSHDLWWTFVTKHGHVYLAGDNDLGPAGGVSWKAPWDFGPILARLGAASLVMAHPAHASVLPELSLGADAAVGVVAAVIRTGWSRQVAVFVPDTEAELAAQTQDSQTTALADLAAEAVFDSIGSTNGPTGARVVVNPTVLGSLTPVGLRIVLQHEITHIATASYTAFGTPRWVVEGFAEYVGNLGSGQPVTEAAQELTTAVRRGGTVLHALPADSDFTVGGSGAAQAYQQAWLACRYLASRAGAAGLLRFYHSVGESLQEPDQAVASALHTVLHETTAGFTAQWLAYVSAQLR